jgi:hypothetical protein
MARTEREQQGLEYVHLIISSPRQSCGLENGAVEDL